MNTSRIAPQTLSAFGLFAIIESKRVLLPLKGVECDFSVLSGVVEVSMTHIFRQENDRAIDCEYLFPLPADASVFFCEADINGRIIRARVRERNEARELAAQKKAAGFRTALVEAERDNLFTLSLGNVQPNDLVIVQLKYFQPLHSLAEMRSLEIPFCPGVRYIPGKPLLRSNRGKGIVDDTDQVPDASRITPVRIDAAHPDAAYIEVRGTFDGEFVAANSLSSPSHSIATHCAENKLRVTLSDKGEVPDRDFVLRWTERQTEAVASRAWINENSAERYALMEIRAPKSSCSGRAPVDFYFLVDRSGSMAGAKWNKAAEALQSCVRVLHSGDRAMITLFETHFQDFAEGPLPAMDLLGDRQFQMIQRLGTGGGTQLLPALRHILEIGVRHSQGRDKNLILITDAQVGNETAILETMKTAPDLPVHCFGIDIALNDSLLLALSRQQGGTFHSLNPADNIQQAVTSLGETLGQPVLLDLQLSDGWELADARIPNLYSGQIHYLSARSKANSPLALTARASSSEPVQIQFENQVTSLQAPRLMWSRSRIDRLIAEGNQKAAIALSTESNLICPLTAFIAWDEAEKVPVANHQLVQPNLELYELCDHAAAARPAVGARPAVQKKAGSLSAANIVTRSLLARTFRRQKFSAGLMEEAFEPAQHADEFRLGSELSDLCLRSGIRDWQSLFTPIFAWVLQVRDQERSRRINELNNLVQELKKVFPGIVDPEDPEQIEARRKQAHHLLTSFIEKHGIRPPVPG